MKVSRYSEFMTTLQKSYSYGCEVCLATPVNSLFAVCKLFDLLKAEWLNTPHGEPLAELLDQIWHDYHERIAPLCIDWITGFDTRQSGTKFSGQFESIAMLELQVKRLQTSNSSTDETDGMNARANELKEDANSMRKGLRTLWAAIMWKWHQLKEGQPNGFKDSRRIRPPRPKNHQPCRRSVLIPSPTFLRSRTSEKKFLFERIIGRIRNRSRLYCI